MGFNQSCLKQIFEKMNWVTMYNPDLLIKIPDPDPAKRSESDRTQIRNTASQVVSSWNAERREEI